MDTTYNPTSVEQEIYTMWEKGGYFSPTIDPHQTPFTIIMPPPNANDPLHIGHAMFITIEDILIRYHRMKGEATLWLPGTDHAGIETQFVFEKKLAKEGKSRFNFDRKTLYQMIWNYVKENSGVAVDQMKKLGASADWNRFKFTLDPDVVDYVLETFIKLHNDSLIYRKEKLVNYCTKCGTSYSDLEVLHEEKDGILYTIEYELVNHKGEYLQIATTRPETLLGDIAVAVNPKDTRYTKYWQQKEFLRLPLVDREIPIIPDEMVDMEFGTGIVKITPSHDKNDELVAERKHMDLTDIFTHHTVIGFNGKMNDNAGIYKGLSIEEARKKIIADLGKHIQQKPYKNSVGVCYRCGKAIEPLPRTQFFVKVTTTTSNQYDLTGEVIKAMKQKEFQVYGAGRAAILEHWLKNLKDWNISRQIVWGIRIPVWYKITGNENLITVSFIDKNGQFHQGLVQQWLDEGFTFEDIEQGLQQLLVPSHITKEYVFVGKEKPQDGKIWFQETDTLDTWFSSGQWPVVTLKTNKPGDFEYFYPTNVMETGYDILPIWVLRMLMMGMYLTKKVPFKDVYLHGLIRDEKGQKMSKSKGNVMNPLDMVEKYGADAVRMALVMSSTPGQDKSVGESAIRGMRNFSNKIWNAARYVISLPENKKSSLPGDQELNNFTQTTTQEVTKSFNDFRIGLAAEQAHNEFWHGFCDKYIEQHKKGEISTEALQKSLEIFLKLLHPFMPFVTEEIWGKLPQKHQSALIISSWPGTKNE